MDTPQTTPSLALAAFSEDLIAGRRVVVFGNALSGLAETLTERGARLIHVYDENPARVAEAAARSTSTTVSFAPLTPGGIAARDGAFDVGFVDEVAAFSDPAQLVTRLRRALSARGVGFVCTANPDVSPLWDTDVGSAPRSALSYYDLYDLVSTQFDEVRMVGQTPFAGYALADFSPDTENEFSIDTGFVPGGAEEPERYVAVCSHFPVSIEPFCVVQMEAASLVGRDEEPDASKAQTAAANTAELSAARAELTTERAAKSKLEQLLRDVNDELKRRDEWVQELESRATTADERADAAESALERLTAKHKSRAEEPRPVNKDAIHKDALHKEALQKEAAQKDAAQLAELTEQLTAKNHTLLEREQQLEELRHKSAEWKQQLAARNRQLDEAQHQLSELRRELDLAQHAKGTSDAAREQAHAKIEALQREAETLSAAGHQVVELQTTVTELRGQVSNLRSDLHLAGDELTRAEEQLTAQAATLRQTRADLADTERFAALLLAERDVSGESKPQTAAVLTDAADVIEVANVIDVAIDSEVDMVPSLATESLLDRASTQAPPVALRNNNDTRALDEARAREAELQAALQATRWTVEELENRLARASNEQELLERLYRAEHQLQRQATLIAQYERDAHAPPTAE